MSAPDEVWIGVIKDRPWYRASATPPNRTYGGAGEIVHYLRADIVEQRHKRMVEALRRVDESHLGHMTLTELLALDDEIRAILREEEG